MTEKYFTSSNGIKLFTGNADNPNAFKTTVLMAENCPSFQMDVEEEVVYEQLNTCYNCRYRRWNAKGFSCYKDFPEISIIAKEVIQNEQE